MRRWVCSSVWMTLAMAAAGQTLYEQMVPAAGPGVFTAKEAGPGRFHLVVAGRQFTSRSAIEKYLAFRAARLTVEKGGTWFQFVEDRAKGESAEAAPARDPEGPRYSFRMQYFRPVWRYKAAGAAEWKRWNPLAGGAFFAGDPKAVSEYEVSADIVVRKGPMDDADPLAYEAWAVSDLLVNQVTPPK